MGVSGLLVADRKRSATFTKLYDGKESASGLLVADYKWSATLGGIVWGYRRCGGCGAFLQQPSHALRYFEFRFH